MSNVRRSPPRVASGIVWCPCPTCWGQGRIWIPRAAGGLTPEMCLTCLGVAQVARVSGCPGP